MILVTPPNVDEMRPTYGFANSTLAPYVDVIRALAKSATGGRVDVFGLLEPADFDRDGVHPNALGHHKMFEQIAAAVDRL